MRILWYSNAPHVGSGYGNQTELFVKRIRDLGHEIAVAAYWGIQGNRVESDGIPIYPAAIDGGINAESMAYPAEHFGADIIISLMDIWALPPGITGGRPLCPWFPVDHEPLQPPIIARLRQPSPIGVMLPLVFSRKAEQLVSDAGVNCRYIPHGVDANVYAPGDRMEARSLIGIDDKIGDDFVIGMVAANIGNPSRKAFKPQIEAFARLRKKHKDVRLYLHTRMDTSSARGIHGENLREFVEQLGIQDAVMFTDPIAYYVGLEADEMAALYRSFDVLTSVSLGEGFGIPILEAQACGRSVIVGDWTAMPELCFSGWKVPKSRAMAYHTGLASYQWWPSVTGIFEQMEAAYLTGPTQMRKRQKQARDLAIAYDADTVARDYWQPTLAHIESVLDVWRHANRNGSTPAALTGQPSRFAEYTNV